jgi:hypothetical protein
LALGGKLLLPDLLLLRHRLRVPLELLIGLLSLWVVLVCRDQGKSQSCQPEQDQPDAFDDVHELVDSRLSRNGKLHLESPLCRSRRCECKEPAHTGSSEILLLPILLICAALTIAAMASSP